MSDRKRKGFTLVELLVVIGIISVLISILLPALNRAREQSRSIVCKSNIRQIYYALISYTNENRSALPLPTNIGETFAAHYDRPCAFFFTTTTAVMDFDNGVLWPYIGPPGNVRFNIVNCPSDLGNSRPTGPTSVGPRNFSYSFNDQLRGQILPVPAPYYYKGIKITQIVHPAQKVLIVEEAYPNDTNADIANPGKSATWVGDQMGNHHNNGSNQGFADGHVDSYTPEDLGMTGTGTSSDPVKQEQFCDLFSK